jgi:NAD(P)-dependent dehydrogenase (short-subunit alcohol dehydrogenase family)
MDKSVIVTGGGYGIGRASCVMLAQEGWKVVTVDRDAERNAGTVAAVIAAGGQARAVNGDVSLSTTAAEAIATARELAPLRALVCAAAMRHSGTVVDITETQWDETLAACLRGVFVFAKAAVPEIAAAGGGAVVTFSSQSALVHQGNIAYASAKAAIEAFTRSLAADHLKQHIRANVIVPPFTVTGMTEQYGDAGIAARDERSPSGRAARPDDLARLVRYLVSEESAMLTGGIFGTTLPLPVR